MVIEKTPDGRDAGAEFCPLTPMERGMYLEQMMHPDSTSYNLNHGIFIRGAEEDTIRRAVREMLSAHEAFRSRYGQKDGIPCRILTTNLPEIKTGAATDRESFEKMLQVPGEPFDLESGVPLRLTLYPLSEGGFALHIRTHHIAIDGGSWPIFMKELKERLLGHRLPEKIEDLSAAALRMKEPEPEALAFFREMFDGGVPANEMPVKGARPKKQPLTDTVLKASLDAGALSALSKRAKQYGVTLFQLLLSVSAAALGKYCASEDVVVGIPVNTRDELSRETIGMFVNTVPVRIRPESGRTLADYFAENAAAVRGAVRDHPVPFETLVSEFCPERDESRNPLYDMSVNYLWMPEPVREDGLTLEFTYALQQMPRDLGLVLQRSRDSLAIYLQYSSVLYDREIMENFLEQLTESLRRLTDTDTVLLRDLMLLPYRQRNELERFSQSSGMLIPEELLHRVFEAHAANAPNHTALIACDRTMTYGELNSEANRAAWSLLANGIKRGDSAILLLPRRSFYFSAMFGVLKAGAAFIPCDPDYPPERIAHILRDSGASCIITTREHFPDYEGYSILDVDDLLAGEDRGNPDTDLTGEDLAYMIYTSGSTGVPKGVMLRHEGICNYLLPHPTNIHYDILSRACSAVLSATTVSFDMSLKETTGALCNGKTLVFANEEEMNDPRALAALLERTGADCFNTTPSRMRQYLEYGPFRKALAGCHLVICGAEGFPAALLDTLKEVLPEDCRIINTYGPTEITVSCNAADLTRADHISVGRPLLNVREYILNANGEPVPKGVVGELYIGGPGVALGYRNLDEQTAKSFVRFGGGRFYRSGDFAKWDADGNVMILGRMDGQIKLRGLRIELGEIESVLEKCPGIRKAVAAVKEIGGREYLCAYYLSDEELDEAALLRQMKEKLTDYMVPRALTRLSKIPVNANGKTDRKALPVPELAGGELDTTAPRTETERRVHAIVAKKTGTDAFGIHVPFMELGVTSLSMVGLMLALGEAFGRPVSISDIKEHDTVAALAAFLDENTEEKVYGPRTEYPLTQTQYGIYVECVKAPETTIYNIPFYLKLSDKIDPGRLERAAARAVDAHPYLKMRLVEGEDAVYARRDDTLPANVKRIRADHLPAAQELVRPYDLLKDPLYRMEIYETPEGNAFYMELHHIAADGKSRVILQRDIERAYAGETLKTEAFTGYEAALAEEEERVGPRYEKAKEWYTAAFADAEASTLPPAQPERGAKSAVDSVWFETDLKADVLEEFCRRRQISLNTLFNAAYGYTLANYAWSEEAVFTTIFNGRSDSRLADSVTMLVKTLPVRLAPEPEKETAAFLGELHRQLAGSMDNTIYSFGEISRNLGIRADTMLCFQGKGISVGKTTSFCGESAAVERPALSAPKTSLTAEVYVKDGGILLRGEYATASYDRAFVEGFLRTLAQAAGELTRAKTLGEISLMYEGAWEPYERENRTEVPVDIVSVNRLFEEQVRLHPDKTAVIAAGESLTFDALNRRANRVAHALAALGVGRDTIVGMVLDRTKEIFIAEHGILKVGGAFLPMVPEYPDERIRYCLLDAESPCVITTEKIKAGRPELFSDDQPYKTLTVEELTASGSEENPELPIPTDSLAYCIYTSGSTGNPKGVMIEHRNMCNYLNANPRHPAIYWHTQDNHCALSVTSISFDMSITERFVSLCNGVTVCMATLDEIHDPRALARLMLKNGTESIVCTPSYLMSLLDEPAMLPAIAALKAYHVGGEAFPSTLIDRLKELNPDSHVMNGYGPTETSVCCTSSEILPEQPITIGKPEANVTHYVLDRQLRPVPKGVCGELIICGAGVGRGYVKLPERTAAAFFTFRGEPAYHSGDLVRLNDEGEYDYYGRLDNQVKLRGLRVELDEIETVMLEYPGVKLSKVIVRNNGKEDYLAGFYTGEREIPAKELKAFLKEKLTPYMVPDALAQLPEMPLTINGKIDKKKLPDIKDAVEAREYEPPKNETEEKFCGFFAKVLKLERVGATDNFFEIGGTSLSAAMVVSQASRNGFDVVYKNVFDHPTPRQLAEFVSRAKPAAASPDDEPKKEAAGGRFRGALEKNRPKYLKGIQSGPLGTVLLTGATGFLGAHVLLELLRSENVDRVICLVRGEGENVILQRVKVILMYYFDNPFADLLERKATLLGADITDGHLPELLSKETFDTIINCAAVVKHFETGDLIRRVNLEGVLRLIDIALAHRARLIQISTLSVAGAFLNELPDGAVLRESACDLGQIPGTKYSSSKLEAEKAILEAIEEKGLRAKIIRVGNLMGRRADGEFQINFRTNGFMNRLKAYKEIGCFPVGQMDAPVEFSPIDMTARAVVLLSGTEDSFTVFHANNCHVVHFANVLEAFAAAGYPLEVVEDDVFDARFAEALEDEEKSVQVSSLVSYNGNATERRVPLPTDNSFTVKALYRLGFSWPVVSLDYMKRSIDALSTFGFFDE